ncbi:MAG: aldo/keto reductase, partial [Nocardioidaceae bacterium]
MRQRRLGNTGHQVGAIGLGCMGMSWAYTPAERDDTSSVALIGEALDLGCGFVDTSDVYGDGHNEQLVGEALHERRDDAFLATKVGLVVEDKRTGVVRRDASPEHIRSAVEASLRRLATDAIDLYYLHRVDPQVPLSEQWGALAELVEQGKVRHLGLSEVSLDQADAAHRQHPVTAIQSELSLWTRSALGEGPPVADGSGGTREPDDIVGWCARNEAAFVPFSPLGRGFLTGTVTGDDFEGGDMRARNPRFATDAMAANQRIVDVVRAVAGRHDATPAQVAIAWTLTRGDHVVPIPGTKKSRYLRENAAAVDL